MLDSTDHPHLEEFLRAYIVTALWASNDESDPETGGDPMDKNYSADDLAPETLDAMRADCAAFLASHGLTIENAIETDEVRAGPDFDEWGRAAHDFWLTRNHHGAGFWDGDWPEPFATVLTDAARKAGECSLYIGDDGKIWSM